jgi:hypothetical protein
VLARDSRLVALSEEAFHELLSQSL